MYLHPGVYIEEIPSGSRPIEAASTSTALIVGYATKGPLSTPTLLFNFDQYVTQFGGIVDFHGSTLQPVDYMGHTVRAFFNNGGSKAYIVRLALDATTTPLAAATGKLIIPPGGGTSSNFVKIEAINPGSWGNGFVVKATPNASGPLYTISVGRIDRQGNFVASETFTDVSLASDTDRNFIATQLNDTSSLVKASLINDGGTSGLGPTDAAFQPFQIGSLTGTDISSFTGFSSLPAQEIDVTLDGASLVTATVTFPATAPSTLGEVAAEIQKQVRGAATANPQKDFTCTVENNKLVLRSGSRSPTAAVAVTAGSPDAAASLGLTGSNVVTKSGGTAAGEALATSSILTLAGGTDGLLPDEGAYDGLIPQLKKIRDISIIFVPGRTWSAADSAGQAIIGKFQAHAEEMKNRMLIIDPARTATFTTSQGFLGENFPTSPHTVTYYPWLEVANPHYHAELRPERARTVFVPPSGFAAGLWARTDGSRGVWKAPAGLQASLIGAANTRVKIGDDEQDQLNPVGVNCFRRIISAINIWGSRTLATKSDPENRYVPVKRTAMMLGESIYQGIQWAVFEPNDHRLWSSLRLNIEAFMGTLFRSGAFQGEKASDAYFVRCGLGDTMTQAEIDAGQVIVIVGFAPLKPAEFVIVRIQQIVGKQ